MHETEAPEPRSAAGPSRSQSNPMTTPNALNLHRSLGLFLVSLLGLAACGASESEEGSSSSFFVGTSEFGVAAGTPLAIEAEWLAFLADEAASGASQLNDHDTDTVDEVAVVVNIDTRVETNLRVGLHEACSGSVMSSTSSLMRFSTTSIGTGTPSSRNWCSCAGTRA